MATSGSANYSVNCLDIIKGAMRSIGVLAVGQTPTGAESEDAREALNMLVKQWQGLTHTLKMWLRKELTITLVDSTEEYTIKLRKLDFTSGGTTAIAVGDTITGATGGATATVCCVTLSSGTWAGGDAAGEFLIYNQVGTFESEELNTNKATIASDSAVYSPVVEVVEGLRRNSDNQDSPLKVLTESEYMAIGNKTDTATPTQYFIVKEKDQFKIRIGCYPSDTTDVLVFVVKREIEDFDANTNDVDFPKEWFRALKYGLAVELAPEYGFEISKSLAFLASDSLERALSFEPEYNELYFQPGKDY